MPTSLRRSPNRLVTIDGPAGCGKSTVARSLADRLHGVAFGTGVIYRLLTFLALEAGVDLTEPSQVLGVLADNPLTLEVVGAELRVVAARGDTKVWTSGAELHEPRVTREIHWLADAAEVRAALLPLQRALPPDRIVVAEGRDLGTVVYPDAPLKVFLTASVEERARRRLADWQQGAATESLDLAGVEAEIEARDRRDRGRPVAPLVAAPDARVVDSTAQTVAMVVQEIMQWVPKKWLAIEPGSSTT
ncbi:MAG: (d)CMP kinase [Planctomycetota bacterium]